MNNNIIFTQIINKEIPAKIVYQDKKITAFKDIKPKAPIHILIIPNIWIKSSNNINKKNSNILEHMFCIAVHLAKKKNINKEGYRIVVNCNANGGQEINYLHMHLLGGKKLGSIC